MKIFVSRRFPGNALDLFNRFNWNLVISEYDRYLTAEEFLDSAKGSDAILSFLTDKINGEVLDALGPQLKVVSNYAVGFDNITVDDATKRGIVIANTPSDEVNEAVAEHTWALMLSLTRRIVEADESTKRGSYRGWEPSIFLGSNLAKKTLGIVGLGRIGTMVAKRAKGWNMRVIYNKRSRDEEAERELGIEFADISYLFEQSDFISLHVPLTSETAHMINSQSISSMKRGVYIINTARGQIIKEQDLVDALRGGQVAGVALDVFENEPNINPELITMENVILTPHIASATIEARHKMGQQAVSAIIDVLEDKMPENIVNKEAWDNRRK